MVPRQEWEIGSRSLFSPWIFLLSSSARGPSARTLWVQSHLHAVVQTQRRSKLSIMDDFIVATYCVFVLTRQVLHTVCFIYHSGCTSCYSPHTQSNAQMSTSAPLFRKTWRHKETKILVKSHRIEIIQNSHVLPLRPSGLTRLPRWHYQANCGLRSHKAPGWI